jgi:hypothetical protein
MMIKTVINAQIASTAILNAWRSGIAGRSYYATESPPEPAARLCADDTKEHWAGRDQVRILVELRREK